MNRRQFLAGAAAGTAISALDWLRFFRAFGVPGTKKKLGLTEAAAEATVPHFLIYWFQEGGWDGYSMFNPVHTPNNAVRVVPAGELRPVPSWSQHLYRPKSYGTSPLDPPKTQGNIQYGYLAQDGLELFNNLAVVSSHNGNTFHSGGRWEYHYGKYSASLSGKRAPDERTVMQAFCEAYGNGFLLPHVSWHRWLADGELSIPSYPDGTGYYERLGPVHAHTIYGKTPRPCASAWPHWAAWPRASATRASPPVHRQPPAELPRREQRVGEGLRVRAGNPPRAHRGRHHHPGPAHALHQHHAAQRVRHHRRGRVHRLLVHRRRPTPTCRR